MILVVGKLLSTKLNDEFIAGPRCFKWKGAAKVSHDEIKRLERTIRSVMSEAFSYIN